MASSQNCHRTILAFYSILAMERTRITSEYWYFPCHLILIKKKSGEAFVALMVLCWPESWGFIQGMLSISFHSCRPVFFCFTGVIDGLVCIPGFPSYLSSIESKLSPVIIITRLLTFLGLALLSLRFWMINYNTRKMRSTRMLWYLGRSPVFAPHLVLSRLLRILHSLSLHRLAEKKLYGWISVGDFWCPEPHTLASFLNFHRGCSF